MRKSRWEEMKGVGGVGNEGWRKWWEIGWMMGGR